MGKMEMSSNAMPMVQRDGRSCDQRQVYLSIFAGNNIQQHSWLISSENGLRFCDVNNNVGILSDRLPLETGHFWTFAQGCDGLDKH